MICSIEKCTVKKEWQRKQRRPAPNTHPCCRIENYGLSRKNSLLAIAGRIINCEYQNLEKMQSIINRRKIKDGQRTYAADLSSSFVHFLESSHERGPSECLVEQEVESSCKREINDGNNNKFYASCEARKTAQLKKLFSDDNVKLIDSLALKYVLESHRKTPTRRANKETRINERARTSTNRKKKAAQQQALHASNRPKKEINNNKKLLSSDIKQIHHKKEFVVQEKLSKSSTQTETEEAGEKIKLDTKSESMFLRPEAKFEILKKTNVEIEQIKNKFQVNNNKASNKKPITNSNPMALNRRNNCPEVKENAELEENMNEIRKLRINEVDRKTAQPMENIVENTKKKTKAIVQTFSLAKISMAQVYHIRQYKRSNQLCRIYINKAAQQQLMTLRTTNNRVERDQNTNIVRRETSQVLSKPRFCRPMDPSNEVQQKDIFYFVLILILIALCGIGGADPYFWRWVFRRLKSFCHKYLYL